MRDNLYTTRTVAIELSLSKEDCKTVLSTISEVNSLYSYVVTKCNEERSVNYYHMATPDKYADYRKHFPAIPSTLVQQIVKEACTDIRSWNKKHKTKVWSCSSKRTANSYPLNKRTLSIRGSLATFSTVNSRIRTLINLPQWFTDKYNVKPNDVQAGSVKVTRGNVVLLLQYRLPIPNNNTEGVIIGIDRGLYNLCTLSDGTIISSKKATAVKRRYQYLRSKLQQKGTKSAKRHLKKLSGKEKRFMSDFNHCVTKQLASRQDVSVYVLEDLKGMRNKRRGKKLNSWLSNWSYYQFEQQLKYKCSLSGILLAFVDPRYTSQKCSCCGTIDKDSRKKSLYTCTSCGHTEHADVNAAKNIRDNYVRSKSE